MSCYVSITQANNLNIQLRREFNRTVWRMRKMMSILLFFYMRHNFKLPTNTTNAHIQIKVLKIMFAYLFWCVKMCVLYECAGIFFLSLLLSNWFLVWVIIFFLLLLPIVIYWCFMWNLRDRMWYCIMCDQIKQQNTSDT